MSITNVYGTASILAELKDGNAKVAFFGDSISNNTGTDFASFFQAATLSWRPDTWKGAWFNTQGGVGQWGLGLGYNAEETLIPGEGADGIALDPPPPGIDHTSANYLRVGTKVGTSLFIYSPGFRQSNLSTLQADREISGFFDAAYGDGPEMFVDSSGSRNLATTAVPVAMGIRFILPNSTDYDNSDGFGIQYVSYNPQSAANTGLRSDATVSVGRVGDFSVESYITATPPDTNNWTGNGAPAGWLWQTQWRHNGGSDWFAADAHFWGQAGDGMTLSYFGGGGWTARSHRDEIGETLNLDGPEDSWAYSTNYMRARMESEGTTHAFVYIGSNDITAQSRSSSELIDDFNLMLTRIRAARPGVKIVVGTLYYGVEDSATKMAYKDEFNTYLKNVASASNDICVIDLATYVYSQKSKADFEADWLDDNIHPNADGAMAMMGYFWDRVVAADTSTTVNFEYSDITDTRSSRLEAYLNDVSANIAERLAKLAGSASSSIPYAIAGNSMYKKLMSCFRRVK